MRVRVWLETEVEADVSVDEFIDELNQLPKSDSIMYVLKAINTAFNVLKSISNASISQMTRGQRELIEDAFKNEAMRYSNQEDK